jgi:hypothetical protein
VTVTPAIREFLVRLDELVDTKQWPALGREEVSVGAGDRVVLVRLPHRTDPDRLVELEVDDRRVVVTYWHEQVPFTNRDEALRFVEMLGDGRIEVQVSRTVAWAKIESYRDGLARPFRRHRMPWPTLHPRQERRRFGFTGPALG